MSRTLLHRRLRRTLAVGNLAEQLQISTAEAVERMAAADARRKQGWSPNRRDVLRGMGLVGFAGAAAATMRPRPAHAVAAWSSDARIAVIGAGMGGLACAYELQRFGVYADIYEANSRVGGRVWSLGGDFSGDVEFPGQVVERGGELIDTLHTTMRGYAREFGLALEDYDKDDGEAFFYVDGELYDEADVIEEYRDLVPTLREDLRSTSGGPTAESHSDGDIELDYTNLEEYLDSRDAGHVIRGALEGAYVGEYGAELADQSCLNLLFFIHADRSSKFREFGVYSDERFHVVGGNQQIPRAMGEALADQITTGHALQAVARTASGAYRLTFATDGGTVEVDYDYVVLALPFSALRHVDLDDSLALPDGKRRAIDELQYGTNAKMMVGFDGRPWADIGGNGGSYAKGLAHLQGTWETNEDLSGATSVLTNYSGGHLGAGYDTSDVQGECARFLADYEQLVPGASAVASRDASGLYRVHLEKWAANPYTRGSYTNNHPGYFTTLEGLVGAPVDRLYFAGEHTDSFYEWQGFMEGAANTGIAAASAILFELR